MENPAGMIPLCRKSVIGHFPYHVKAADDEEMCGDRDMLPGPANTTPAGSIAFPHGAFFA